MENLRKASEDFRAHKPAAIARASVNANTSGYDPSPHRDDRSPSKTRSFAPAERGYIAHRRIAYRAARYVGHGTGSVERHVDNRLAARVSSLPIAFYIRAFTHARIRECARCMIADESFFSFEDIRFARVYAYIVAYTDIGRGATYSRWPSESTLRFQFRRGEPRMRICTVGLGRVVD